MLAVLLRASQKREAETCLRLSTHVFYIFSREFRLAKRIFQEMRYNATCNVYIYIYIYMYSYVREGLDELHSYPKRYPTIHTLMRFTVLP